MSPPRGAHPVEAPFRRTTVSQALTGTYIVEVATVSGAPDVSLHTTNGSIHTTLYFQGGLPRPIGLDVHSVSGQIGLAVPEQQHAQKLDMRVNSVNGQLQIYLPDTFKGKLTLSSVNGHLELGAELARHSKLTGGDSTRDMVFYVDPESKVGAQEKGALNENSAMSDLEDQCHCRTVSGAIFVEYYSASTFEGQGEFAWARSQPNRDCCTVS